MTQGLEGWIVFFFYGRGDWEASCPRLNPEHINFFVVIDRPVDFAVFLEGI